MAPFFSILVTVAMPTSRVLATWVPPQGCRSTPAISTRRTVPLPVGGGTPSALPGGEGKAPRGLTVGGDKLYFSGRSGGKAGVYSLPLAGGKATKSSARPAGVTRATLRASRKLTQ